MTLRILIATHLVFVLLVAGSAGAACPSDGEVAERAVAYLDKRPVKSYGAGLSVDDGYCAQTKFVRILAERFGPPVGYKVGFASKALQERFRVTEPARGVLFAPMLLPSGSELPANFGVRPLVEPDLAVSIKDEGVNSARTPLEAAAHVDKVLPFIELPDLVVSPDEPLTAAVIIAVNVLPRHGVLGPGIAVQATPEFVESLGRMEAVLTDDTGKEYGRVQGAALLGNPLNALLWLVGHMSKSGLKLRGGDVVSLGALGGLYPPESGRTYTLRYEGLPGGTIQTSVRIR
jgi:2-keto-4-pentenoate hydratase